MIKHMFKSQRRYLLKNKGNRIFAEESAAWGGG